MTVMRFRPDDFMVDGALRDLCIFDTDLRDWERMVTSLSSSSWDVRFRLHLPDREVEVLESVRELFDRLAVDGEISAAMSVRVGDLWFACYFFDPDEIEFTFDPRDVTDETSFASLEQFMTWLAETIGKRVVMTMETIDHRLMPALLEVRPDARHPGSSPGRQEQYTDMVDKDREDG